MPIYEYNCGKCGNQFEVLIRTKADVPGKCPKCGGKVAKALSTFAVAAGSSHGHEHSPACAHCPSSDSGACDSGACPMSGM